jgi:hypothetical protein
MNEVNRLRGVVVEAFSKAKGAIYRDPPSYREIIAAFIFVMLLAAFAIFLFMPADSAMP